MDEKKSLLQSRMQANLARIQGETPEKEPRYYPLDDEFGYNARTHCWELNGQPISDEEADVIYRQKMDERLARRRAELAESEATMTSLDDIRRQAGDLEIEVEIDRENRLVMQKRGGGNPRFYSLQECDEPAVLQEAQAWLDRYRTFLTQHDQARGK